MSKNFALSVITNNKIAKKLKKQTAKKPFAFIIPMIFSISFLEAQNCNPCYDSGVIRPSAIIQVPKANVSKIKSDLRYFNEHHPEIIGNLRYRNFRSTNGASTRTSNTSSHSISVERSKPDVCSPTLQISFEGNPLTPFYLPPVGYYASESNIAISNAGKIVSISNGWIRYYDESGALTFSDSLYHFCSGLIDVRVLYDPKKDRFVFTSAYGFTNFASTFQPLGVLIAFSKTGDPRDGWNFYYISPTDYKDKSAFDYPQLAISNDEAFITLLYPSNSSPTIKHFEILQLDKNAGYAGAISLNLQKYEAPVTNALKGSLVPAQGGSTTYGPNMYFVMANELSNASNKYLVYEVTNTIGSGNAVLKKYGPVTSNIYYEVPSFSYQPGNILLSDNSDGEDDWLQNAFFENGMIQFCQSTNAGDRAAIYLGRIRGIPNNLSCIAKTVSDPGLSLKFPSIAYAGNSSSDNSAIVGIQHVAENSYPGLSAVYVNSNFDVSALTTLKAGTDTINGLWGDYSGICRRYNHPGESWFEGQYGSNVFPNINWITKLSRQANCEGQTIASRNIQIEKLSLGLIVYPNPVSSSASISFAITQTQNVSLKIFDINGKMVKVLADTKFEKGQYLFKWNIADVSAGIYVLQFDSGIYSTAKKLVVIK